MDSSEDRAGLLKQLLKYFGFGTQEKDGEIIVKLEDSDVAGNEEIQKTVNEQVLIIKGLQAKDLARDALAAAVTLIGKAETEQAVDQALSTFKTEINTIKSEHELSADNPVAKFIDGLVEKDAADAVQARKSNLESEALTEAQKDFRDMLPEKMRGEFDKMDEKSRKDFIDRFNKSADDNGDGTVNKAMETLLETNKSLENKVEKLEHNELVRTTKAELADLEGKVGLTKFVENVITLRKHDKDAADEMIAEARKLAAQADTGSLFKSFGSQGDGAGGEAEGKIMKMAEKLKAESSEDMSIEQAYAKVLEDNPELYSQSLQENATAAH